MKVTSFGSKSVEVMNIIKTKVFLLGCLLTLLGCSSDKVSENSAVTRDYLNQIIDISYTPNNEYRAGGWFVDQGAWMGFTPAEADRWINGFCGPYSLDSRAWLATSAVELIVDEEAGKQQKTNYYPGVLSIATEIGEVVVDQKMIFANSNTALLAIDARDLENKTFYLSGRDWIEGSTFTIDRSNVIINHPNGEITTLTFPAKAELELVGANYRAELPAELFYVAISTFVNKEEKVGGLQKAENILIKGKAVFAENRSRWEGFLKEILRDDMPDKYHRIAAKAMVTLMSNWKASRGGLLHEGMVPSHAVGYFMGYWAWDTWKFVVPLARLTPELSKNMIRSMFDYQQEDGMIIDCIYANPAENNYRDSKPPLAGWAIDAVYEATKDTAFLREMYPQLLKYHRWWYEKRDNDKNGICEFGSTDGTIEAAAWESGMDNAIRFDNAKMVKNSSDAWSFDQESVDLNAFLAYEYQLIKKFSDILNIPFDDEDKTQFIATYFYDNKTGFFFDKKIGSGEFIKEFGSEAYIPFWAKLASKEQMDAALPYFKDTTMYATYIPFPTIAANNPKYLPNGYWRGPIWLDQTYFGINGLRNYGHKELADTYTLQVFDRLDGLTGDKPIHENYDSHTGGRLKAPHFSWSASHLLLLYNEYGK